MPKTDRASPQTRSHLLHLQKCDRFYFFNRLDKDWGLTDCISFVIMEQEGITEAFTADKHFSQAGFIRLLT